MLYYKFNTSALDALEFRPNGLLVKAGVDLAAVARLPRPGPGPQRRRSTRSHPIQATIRRDRTRAALPRHSAILEQPARRRGPRPAGHADPPVHRAEVPDAVTSEAGALLYSWFA